MRRLKRVGWMAVLGVAVALAIWEEAGRPRLDELARPEASAEQTRPQVQATRRGPVQGSPGVDAARPTRPPDPAATGLADDEALVADLFASRRSDVEVEVSGRVVRVLRDDREGSPHQRFVLALAGGHELLVAHNLELAPRVPLELGDDVEVRGEYEWNARGGVLHWTHDDPRGHRAGGWVRHEGQLYR